MLDNYLPTLFIMAFSYIRIREVLLIHGRKKIKLYEFACVVARVHHTKEKLILVRL